MSMMDLLSFTKVNAFVRESAGSIVELGWMERVSSPGFLL